MQSEQATGDDDKPTTIRVVMSGEYFMPYNNVAKMKIAQNRIAHISPYVWSKHNSKNKRKVYAEKGIRMCFCCSYPQPIENTICCFCENILSKK